MFITQNIYTHTILLLDVNNCKKTYLKKFGPYLHKLAKPKVAKWQNH